jgi:hypothetical protein
MIKSFKEHQLDEGSGAPWKGEEYHEIKYSELNKLPGLFKKIERGDYFRSSGTAKIGDKEFVMRAKYLKDFQEMEKAWNEYSKIVKKILKRKAVTQEDGQEV